MLSLEIGGEDDQFNLRGMRAAASDPSKSINKQAMEFIKQKASRSRGVRYLSPGGEPHDVPGTDGVRAFVLGPPRRESLLTDEDPTGEEGFPGRGASHGLSFAAAVSPEDVSSSPFSLRYQIPPNQALRKRGGRYPLFPKHYGKGEDGVDYEDNAQVPDNAAWRRIDDEWLYSAESLALKLNRGINNTSLVLAFELPKSGKILLFAGDAQRGSWVSWSKCQWQDGSKVLETRGPPLPNRALQGWTSRQPQRDSPGQRRE